MPITPKALANRRLALIDANMQAYIIVIKLKEDQEQNLHVLLSSAKRADLLFM
jgi:BarA-like signal transduction histidine kinase